MNEQPLSNIRIVDLTHHIAGPYCTKLAAGFGAEVIKVERPSSGDPLRNIGPFHDDQPGLERSIPFLWLNTGKKSVTLNLKSAEGVEIIKSLVEEADVVVENFKPTVLPGLGLDYSTLSKINPRLVMASISNFGQSGVYRDFSAEEIELYALSGAMYVTGDSARAPLGSGPAICQYTAGLHAYLATLMALFQRQHTDQGQHLDIAIMEGAIDLIESRMAKYLEQGKTAKRGSHAFAPWGLYACQDGYAAVVGAPFRHWTRGAEIFEEPHLLDRKYRHVLDRVRHRHEVDELMEPWLRQRTRQEVYEAGRSRNMAFGYLASIDEVIDSRQHAARDFLDEIDHPHVGRHKYCGAPFKMSKTSWVSLRAPLLGEHNDAVYQNLLSYSREKIASLYEAGVI